MIKTIVFDFDGTIGDTAALIVTTMKQTIDALGLRKCSDEQYRAMIGLPLRETFMRLIPMSEETGRQCEATYQELFSRNNRPGTVPLFPNVRETLSRLHARGITLTVASSRARQSLLGFIEEMQLGSYISRVVSATDVPNAKPAPDMVHDILRHLGGSPEETLVVGDTSYDIDMGRNAGTKTCAVTYGNGTLESLSSADYIINDFGELENIVEKECQSL
ncbi:MAG: HAD family hydrolase [Prevotella sp.]